LSVTLKERHGIRINGILLFPPASFAFSILYKVSSFLHFAHAPPSLLPMPIAMVVDALTSRLAGWLAFHWEAAAN